MVVALWSTKGGSGTTTCAVGMAAVAARQHRGVLLVDLNGDVSWALGVRQPGPGVSGWLEAGADVGFEAWMSLEHAHPSSRVSCVPWGTGRSWAVDRHEALLGLLANDPRQVIVDAGTLGQSDGLHEQLRHDLIAGSDQSLLVTRGCSIGMARVAQSPVPRTGVLLVREPGHPLEIADIEVLAGAPVVGRIDLDAAVCSGFDRGRLAERPPRSLTRGLAGALR